MIRRFNKKRQDNRKFYRINERIFASQLRVLDAEGKQVGVLTRFEALQKAKELEVDLVEVAPMASPPVVRLIDFKKFLYQESKKEKTRRRKEARFRRQKRLGLVPS